MQNLKLGVGGGGALKQGTLRSKWKSIEKTVWMKERYCSSHNVYNGKTIFLLFVDIPFVIWNAVVLLSLPKWTISWKIKVSEKNIL